MAISTILTKSSLQQFADYMSIHPLSFNSIDVSTCIDGVIPCETWMQYIWQNTSFISREMLATYLQEAENSVESYLEMFIKPTYIANEEHQWPIFYRIGYGKNNLTRVKFQTKWRNIHYFGTPTKTFLANRPITFSDDDLDGYNEIATFTYTLPNASDITLESLRFYYPSKNGEEEWELKDIELISFDTNTRIATFRAKSWTLINDTLITTAFGNVRYLNGCTDIFLSTIDVYYTIKNTCSPEILMVWKDKDICMANNCSEFILPACASIIDKCDGIFTVSPMKYDEDNCVIPGIDTCFPATPPDLIRINYVSGYSANNHKVALTQAIFKLTASKLPQQLCTCGCIEREIKRLQLDTSISFPQGERYNFPFEVRNNPFGTTIGAIEAYKLLENIFHDLC